MASPAGREPDRGTEYELKSKNRLEAVAVPSTLRQHTPSAHCTSPRRSSALRRQGKIAAKMDAHALRQEATESRHPSVARLRQPPISEELLPGQFLGGIGIRSYRNSGRAERGR